jgi:adenylate cyclase class 2
MSDQNSEIEVKFYISNLEEMETKLNRFDAEMLRHRSQEYNLRFDTPNGDLARSIRVLRLRQDNETHLTYKGPGIIRDGIRYREEIEVEVSSFEDMRSIIEALGYQVSIIYEKYRCVFALDNVLVTLDEMPYGNFIEIEGPDSDSIRIVSEKLGLDWSKNVPFSYIQLFYMIREKLAVSIENLTFSDFSDIEITPELLDVEPADLDS